MLGESGDEGAPSGRPAARRKLILRKTSGVDHVHSKALDSEGFQRVLNRESTVRRQCREEDERQGALYNINLTEKEMLKAGVGLHEELEG